MRPPLAVLLLASLVVTSGCLGFLGEPRPPSDQQAQDALNRSRAALDDVTSYRVQSTGSAVATGDGRTESASMSGHAVVNVSARKLNATARYDNRNGRMFVSAYTAYTECRLSGWGRQNLSESREWFDYTPIGEQLDVLTRAPVYWRGTERLNGTETAVVVAHPTEEELKAAPNLLALRLLDSEDANFVNATYTVWLDAETWRPLQTHQEVILREQGVTVTFTATWRIEEYDTPATVERPTIRESDVRPHGC